MIEGTAVDVEQDNANNTSSDSGPVTFKIGPKEISIAKIVSVYVCFEASTSFSFIVVIWIFLSGSIVVFTCDLTTLHSIAHWIHSKFLTFS